MTMTAEHILLLKNGFLALPKGIAPFEDRDMRLTENAELGTVLQNMAYFGYAPSKTLLGALAKMETHALSKIWGELRPTLAKITGDDRKMDDFVVYKNFPREVLEMSEGQYWVRQICMYIGLSNDLFTQEAEDRPDMHEKLSLKVLDLAGEKPFDKLLAKLTSQGASWQPDQLDAVDAILSHEPMTTVDLSQFAFRGNGVKMAVMALSRTTDAKIITTSATDVLRLAAALSGADAELKEKPRFKKFKRSERRFLVELLSKCTSLAEDFGQRPEIWKRLLSLLHPGDFKYEVVNSAYADLYDGSKGRFTARIEAAFKAKDEAALDILSERPGVFMRELHRAYGTFGSAAFEKFKPLAANLTVEQLLKISGYLDDTGAEPSLIRPRGNWTKAQAITLKKSEILPEHRKDLLDFIGAEIGRRVDAALPDGVDLDLDAYDVALATNGQELASYGRGTEFDIPKEMTFLRTASYWSTGTYDARNSWWDNGWNFFYEDWQPANTCCWNQERTTFGEKGQAYAVFSGDPTNSKDMKGRACQMIDLYLNEMEAAGIRYAVWSILCYSGVSFSNAEEVLATLQWGEDPQSGKLYEPARAQMVFPLKGDQMTKFVAYIDVKRRKLVYMDAAFPGITQSAAMNLEKLSELMPAFAKFARSVPTVGALFAHAKTGTIPVRKTDAGEAIRGEAYVFQRTNTESEINQIDLEPLLSMTASDADALLEKREVAA